MSLSRFQLQFHLEKQANNIRHSPAFHTAIVKHGELLKETYKKHPLFYKIIFRNSRFIICSTILSIYYHQPTAGLKDIKAFFKGKNMISENSLTPFCSFCGSAAGWRSNPANMTSANCAISLRRTRWRKPRR